MYYVGIDIGGTKCAVTLGDGDKNNMSLLKKSRFLTKKNPYETLEECMVNLNRILNECSLAYSDIIGIGISCGGPLDSEKGIILSPPNLPGWDDVHIVQFFEDKTKIKTLLQNDANACAVAEWEYGAGKNTKNMIFLTFGTGLGAGIIINGTLYSGTSSMAGEVGHIRLKDSGPIGYGKHGSAEGFCSGGGIAQLGITAVKNESDSGKTPRLLCKAADYENINAKLIADLALQGDELCLNIYKKCGENLGALLSILIDVLNPELIVMGGIYMRSEKLLKPYIEAVVNKETLEQSRRVCKIVPAGLGENVGDYSALALASQILPETSYAVCSESNKIYNDLFLRYPKLIVCKNEIMSAFLIIKKTYEEGGKVLCCGNGGSCADSDHIVGELMKSFLFKRKIKDDVYKKLLKISDGDSKLADKLEGTLPAVSLCSHNALSSAFANDAEPNITFAQQLYGLGEHRDTLIALSTSGNSQNCIYAVEVAKALGIKAVALTGESESRLSKIADVTIKVPEHETYKVQELHLPVYHTLCAMLECCFFEY